MSVLHLRDMPKSVKKHVLKVQGEIKAEKGMSVYSQQSAIYQIIREHAEMRAEKKKT